MSHPKPTNISQLSYQFGLAVDEIKLERSINSMAHLIDSYHTRSSSNYLMNEKISQEEQLQSIKKLRSEKTSSPR